MRRSTILIILALAGLTACGGPKTEPAVRPMKTETETELVLLLHQAGQICQHPEQIHRRLLMEVNRLKDQGITVEPSLLLKEFLDLVARAEARRGVKRTDYSITGEYLSVYDLRRREGLDHDATITRMDADEKL